MAATHQLHVFLARDLGVCAEEDVGGDDDAGRAARLGDPVVGRIEAAADDLLAHQRMDRNPQMLVADEGDRHFEAPGDLVDFVLHGAGVGVDEDVDELVQDTFIKAFSALDSFRSDSSLRTWLFTIERRLVIDRRRSAARRGRDRSARAVR